MTRFISKSPLFRERPLGSREVTGEFNQFWNQANWFIDPVNGNDSNGGEIASQAIKTAKEYRRRVGPIHEFDRNILMTIMSSLPVTDTLNMSGVRPKGWNALAPFPPGPFTFTVRGIEKAVAGGVAVVRQPNLPLNIQYGMSCSSLGSLSPYISFGRMVKKTSGTNSIDTLVTLSTSMWLAKNEDGITARLSWPAFLDEINFPKFQCNEGVFVTGDSFEIVDLCKVPIFEAPIAGSRAVRFERIFFSCDDSSLLYATGQTYIQCAFRYFIASLEGSLVSDCQFGWLVSTLNGANIYVTQGLFLGTILVNDGRMSIENYSTLQAVETYLPTSTTEGEGGGVSCHTRGFGVYDSPIGGIVIPHTQIWYINGFIWGSGNTGHPIEIQRGGKLFLDPSGGNPTITGGSGLSDILLGQRDNGPAIDPITWAYTANRAYSFANLALPVAAGGFGGNIFDPLNPSTAIVIGD